MYGKRKTVVLLYTSRLEHLKTGSKHNPPERFTKTKSRRETYVSRKMAVSGNFPDGLGSITEHTSTSVETTGIEQYNGFSFTVQIFETKPHGPPAGLSNRTLLRKRAIRL